jgi:hypothetical protein
MNTYVRTIFWVVLLLVGINFATPDPVEVTPAVLSDGAAVWDVLDDDVLGHALTHWVASNTDLLPLLPGIAMAMLAVLGAARSFLRANDPKQLALSRRIPRSAPTY